MSIGESGSRTTDSGGEKDCGILEMLGSEAEEISGQDAETMDKNSVENVAPEHSSPPAIPVQPSVIKLIRLTPVVLLEEYLGARITDAAALLSTDLEGRARVRELVDRIGELDDDDLGGMAADAERILEMTDDLGQESLYATAIDREGFAGQENAEARSLWLFLKEPGSFRRAEEIRYADNYRLGRMWDGFIGPKGATISEDQEHHRAFEERIRIWFRSSQIKVEIFERSRHDLEDGDSHLIQVVVYREGLPESFLAFAEDGDLAQGHRRPVYEFALTYEADAGVIEVIAQDRRSREVVARTFTETLLGQEIANERIPLRQYDLTSLMNPCQFPTDAEDGITDVEVSLLTLRPGDGGMEDVDIRADRESDRSIHEGLHQWFEEHNPLTTGFSIRRARLSVRFHPEKGFGQGKTIHVLITLPNGCSLKGKSDRERLICEKYLPRWGMVQEV